MVMTGRDIIKRGYRKLGSIASGDDPSADELNDGFIALNSMMRALHGDVIGPRLAPQALTASLQAENGGLYQCNLAAPATLTAPLRPKNGARFGVIDTGANFATENLTIGRNGQLVQGSATNLVLSASGFSGVWFFDADTGNWALEADLANVDTSPPYTTRLISFLPDMLAVFMAGEFGGELRPDVIATANTGMLSFARTYSRRGRNQLDAPLGVGLAAQGAASQQ